MSIQLSQNGSSIKMNFPIMKSEKMEDGRLMIEGVATNEAIDHTNEIVDYESAKTAFADWKGNIREQHDPKKAVGKAIEVIADDASKQIIVKAFISKGAQDTQAKILDGTLSDFSIGGRVEKRVKEKVQKGDGEVEVTRLIMKRISETSVVDSGCNPETSFSIVKADGDSLLLVGAEDGDEGEEAAKSDEPTAIDQLADMLNKGEVTAEQLVAFAKGEQAPAAAAELAADPAAETTTAPEAAKADDESSTQKGMYDLSSFSNVICSIGYMVRSAAEESEWEGDNSPLPAAMLEWLKTGVQIFKDMAEEETAELIAQLDEKFPAPVAVATVVENADGKTDDVAKAEFDSLQDSITKALEIDSASSAEDVTKAIDGLRDEVTKARDRIKELEGLAAPGKALLKAITKGDDVDPEAEGSATPAVKSADGQENDIATMIKSIHQSGGRFVG